MKIFFLKRSANVVERLVMNTNLIKFLRNLSFFYQYPSFNCSILRNLNIFLEKDLTNH